MVIGTVSLSVRLFHHCNIISDYNIMTSYRLNFDYKYSSLNNQSLATIGHSGFWSCLYLEFIAFTFQLWWGDCQQVTGPRPPHSDDHHTIRINVSRTCVLSVLSVLSPPSPQSLTPVENNKEYVNHHIWNWRSLLSFYLWFVQPWRFLLSDSKSYRKSWQSKT